LAPSPPFPPAARPSGRSQPDDILAHGGPGGLPSEEARAAEDRMGPAECNHAAGERLQVRTGLVELPVVPGQLVVLVVGIVVAVLGAADLVATLDHREALREEERRQEVALLASAQVEDALVGGRPLRAAV